MTATQAVIDLQNRYREPTIMVHLFVPQFILKEYGHTGGLEREII